MCVVKCTYLLTSPVFGLQVRGAVSEPTLSTILGGFDTFDERMDEGKRARLMKDRAKIAEMEAEIERLTKALNSQVNQRREMNQQLQKICETRIEVPDAA